MLQNQDVESQNKWIIHEQLVYILVLLHELFGILLWEVGKMMEEDQKASSNLPNI